MYKVAEFVPQILQIFAHFVPVRALNRAVFSACERQTSDLCKLPRVLSIQGQVRSGRTNEYS